MWLPAAAAAVVLLMASCCPAAGHRIRFAESPLRVQELEESAPGGRRSLQAFPLLQAAGTTPPSTPINQGKVERSNQPRSFLPQLISHFLGNGGTGGTGAGATGTGGAGATSGTGYSSCNPSRACQCATSGRDDDGNYFGDGGICKKHWLSAISSMSSGAFCYVQSPSCCRSLGLADKSNQGDMAWKACTPSTAYGGPSLNEAIQYTAGPGD